MVDDEPPELSDEERSDLLELYDGLRVADVADGLDREGFGEANHVDGTIRPLHRDPEAFIHRFVGFARTLRFHPTNRRRPPRMDADEFDEWEAEWYGEYSRGPQIDAIREGDAMVIEAHATDVGNVGSANALAWVAAGAVGVVTNGGIRDTDEVVKQEIPAYAKRTSRTIRPGRTELDARDVPVNVGGCLVRPGDVVVADGDGVVVVPVEHAREVGAAAREVQRADQRARTDLYEEAGLEKDFTLGAEGDDA